MPQEPRRTIDLFVRSLADQDTSPQLPALLDRLECLTEAGELDDYDVHVWGERISTDDAVSRTGAGARIRNRIIEFREWASDLGYELSGGFERRSIHSAITGETNEHITLPTVALCERSGETIETVVPHESGDGVVTVADYLSSRSTAATVDATAAVAATATDD